MHYIWANVPHKVFLFHNWRKVTQWRLVVHLCIHVFHIRCIVQFVQNN